MAVLRNRLQAIRLGVRQPQAFESRVMTLELDWTQPGKYVAISEAFGNAFYILSVRVWAIWKVEGAGPIIDFRITTGVGKSIDYATVSGEWEPVIPVVFETKQTSWIMTPKRLDYTWSLCKAFSGQGRRLGITCQQFDNSHVYFYCSFEITEG